MNNKLVKLPAARPEPTPGDLAKVKSALDAKAAKFNLFAIVCILAGVGLSVAITLIFWATQGSIVIWALPALLVGGGGGVGMLQVKWSAQQQIEKIDLTLRKLARQEKGLP
ncbi:MAG: hypothetical protein H6841_05575 [Planctomycetes bacterium]|nr:hypothetical protein [Planctomycetota bacterium]MCB9934376.1 hypothetical protein [Planctomycetota bacterium]